MTILVSLVAGIGAALVASGIPLRRTPSLRDRTDHYVAGIRPGHDRSSSTVQLVFVKALSRFSIATAEEMAARLETAGRAPSVTTFRIEQLLWGIGAGAATTGILAVAFVMGAEIAPWAAPSIVALSAVTGILGRDWWLARQAAGRRSRIAEEIPVALDLAAMSVMAGEGVTAALRRAGTVLPGPFGDELRRMSGDIRAGSSSMDALEALRRRCDLASIDRFVQAVVIAMERGTPLSDVLRAQVDDAREARRRQLMETGARREVLMLIPVVFILLPTVILFALYPALVSLELVVP